MAVDAAREAALKVLYEVNEKGAYSNIALNRQLESGELQGVDRAFVTELVYGVLKWRLTIDRTIQNFSNIRLKKISPWILNILRLGVYQLLYASKVPESAACNESVKLAAKHGHSASSGFVNAVLRNIARNRDNLGLTDNVSDRVQYLSIKYSHPEWMVKRFTELFGDEFTESLLDADNGIPEFTVRVNSLKTTPEELVEKLASEGVEAVPGRYGGDALILKNPSSIARLEAFRNGLFQVQDESSMLAARVLDPKPGEFVIDACSAPGGKATHIAQLMENRGTVLARDVFEHKVRLVADAALRLGIKIISTEVYDASIPDPEHAGQADRVLLDAPCTGLGIMRRKPDIRWSRDIEDGKAITGLQFRLINAAASCLKPGGVMVYSTCTILPEENGELVLRFLTENAEYFLDDVAPYVPAELAGHAKDGGMLQLYPNRDGVDGFFIARLKKRR
jgi:16S rRNA (cytosine967-C5)-methyltransferase